MPRSHWGVATTALEEQPLRFEAFEIISIGSHNQDRYGMIERKRKEYGTSLMRVRTNLRIRFGTCFIKCACNEAPFCYNSATASILMASGSKAVGMVSAKLLPVSSQGGIRSGNERVKAFHDSDVVGHVLYGITKLELGQAEETQGSNTSSISSCTAYFNHYKPTNASSHCFIAVQHLLPVESTYFSQRPWHIFVEPD